MAHHRLGSTSMVDCVGIGLLKSIYCGNQRPFVHRVQVLEIPKTSELLTKCFIYQCGQFSGTVFQEEGSALKGRF